MVFPPRGRSPRGDLTNFDFKMSSLTLLTFVIGGGGTIHIISKVVLIGNHPIKPSVRRDPRPASEGKDA